MKKVISILLFIVLCATSFGTIKYRDSIGVYHNISEFLTPSGEANQIVMTKSLVGAVSAGEIPGAVLSVKFGAISSFAPGDLPLDIWPLGVSIDTIALKTNGSVIAISSSSTNDIATGIGVRTLFVSGIDSSWDIADEVVTMNGTTPVNTTNSYIAINRMYVKACGTHDTNYGNISAVHTASTIGYIMADHGQTEQVFLTTPRNTVTQVVGPFVGIIQSGVVGQTMSARIMSKEFGEGWRIRSYGETSSNGTSYLQTPVGEVALFSVGPMSRIKMRVYGATSSGTGAIAGFGYLILPIAE